MFLIDYSFNEETKIMDSEEHNIKVTNSILEESQSHLEIIKVMNDWSESFSKLFLPSNIGSKATIKQITDEDAKVLSIGVLMGLRTASPNTIPYDGSTYEGQTIRDESTGTLWAYKTEFPDGFAPMGGEKFHISLGHVFKCHRCRGHGRIQCWKCDGKVRWITKKSSGESVEHVCTCGDGKQECSECTGYGELLKVLQVDTSYTFDEKKIKDYSGNLPDSLLMCSPGNLIFNHESEFEKRVIVEAIDGFDSEEFNRLMIDMHLELKNEIEEQLSKQLICPDILYNLSDEYFNNLSNPVDVNRRLQEEILPVRMKCEVWDIPIKAVEYSYKDKDYSLYMYGNNAKVWVHGEQPAEFTWKVAIALCMALIVLLYFLNR